MQVSLIKNGLTILKGEQETIREKIEKMVAERLGILLEFQESTDEGEFQIFLHTDSYDYLSEKDIEQLKAMKITDDPDISTEGIKRLLNIDFHLIKENIA